MIKWWDRIVGSLVTLWPKEADSKEMVCSQSLPPYWWHEPNGKGFDIFYFGYKDNPLDQIVDCLSQELIEEDELYGARTEETIRLLEAIGNKKVNMFCVDDKEEIVYDGD